MNEPRSGVYRSATREAAERAYHVDARAQVDEGFVPASEDWSTALGQEVLTVRYVFAPDQAPAVLDALTRAEQESKMATMAPRIEAPPSATTALPVQPPVVPAVPAKRGVPLLVVAVVVLLVVAWQLGAFSSLFPSQTSQGVPTDNLPPAGQVWFGRSFDPTTFAVRLRLTAVSTNESFVAVARLPHDIDASELQVRAYLDGQLVASQAINSTDVGSVWGVNLGPLFTAGEWRYEFADIGGNVLASGSITAQ